MTRTQRITAILYLTKRNMTIKCTCGQRVYMGRPDSSKKRHGFCKCGLAWHYTFEGKQYAHPYGDN